MIFSIYLTMVAVFAMAATDSMPVKIIACVIICITTACANYSYQKLKKEVKSNREMIKKTGKFLLETSERLIDLMKKEKEQNESERNEN